VLLLALLAGTLAFILASRPDSGGGVAANAGGQVTFFDSPNASGTTDALKIVVSGLSAPTAGSEYDAWLVDETGEHTIRLGALSARGSVFSLNFAGSAPNGQAGANLLGSGNVVEITQEAGRARLPAGKVLLAGTFAPRAFIHIKHLLFSFPTTPAQIGLLVGLQGQTRLLNAQALALASLASNAAPGAVACLAQSIIDISEGQQGARFQPLPAACGSSLPGGDGFGILGTNGYAATAATHASLAATQSDSSANIRLHASEVETGTTSIAGLVTTIDRDARQLLNNPGESTGIQEIATLANHAFQGIDSNGSGQIDPVASEEGATTAYLRGQLMASLTLLPRREARSSHRALEALALSARAPVLISPAHLRRPPILHTFQAEAQSREMQPGTPLDRTVRQLRPHRHSRVWRPWARAARTHPAARHMPKTRRAFLLASISLIRTSRSHLRQCR
jgi:hypothetical protein